MSYGEALDLAQKWARQHSKKKESDLISGDTLEEAGQLTQQYLSDMSLPGSLLQFLKLTLRRLTAFDEKASITITRDDLLETLSHLTGLPKNILDDRQGLDLQGGLQVLLEADLSPEAEVTREQMDTSRQIIDRRVNALGVTEPLVQVEGERRILVELPGIDNPEEAVELIQETALLEFVDTGAQPLPEGMCIRTSLNQGPSRCELAPGASVTRPDTRSPDPSPAG